MESKNTNTSVLRNIDWPTVIIYLLLLIAGVVSIYSASYDFDNASIFSFEEFSGKQIRWVGCAIVAALVILLIDFRIYEAYAYPIYIILILLLIVTIFIAPDIKGSRSWLVLGPMSLQPAEFGKFATALALSKLFSSYNFSLNSSPVSYLKALLIIFLPIVLILAQKETGSALAYLALFFVLYREGMSGLVLTAALFAVVFFVTIVKYSENMIMGIPTGEVSVFIMIEIIIVSMMAIYCKVIWGARTLLFWFLGTGIAAWIADICGIVIPGEIFFLSVIGIALLYCLFLLFRGPVKKIIITVGAAVIAIAFMIFGQ